jgi:response regulator of citrate/malate metabolism
MTFYDALLPKTPPKPKTVRYVDLGCSEREKQKLPRGTAHWNAKVTAEKIAEIRTLKGSKTSADVARQFAISRTTVRRIWASE